MKNKKWLWWTLTLLATLIVLAVVGGTGYRMGMVQGVQIAQNADGTNAQPPYAFHMRGFDGDFKDKPGKNKSFGYDRGQGYLKDKPGKHPSFGYDRGRGFDRFEGGRGGKFFSAIFGLLHLAVLGLLIWGGYTLFKKSGWKFVKENAPVSPPVDEKKE